MNESHWFISFISPPNIEYWDSKLYIMKFLCARRAILLFFSFPFLYSQCSVYLTLHLAEGQKRGPAAASLPVFVLGLVPSN